MLTVIAIRTGRWGPSSVCRRSCFILFGIHFKQQCRPASGRRIQSPSQQPVRKLSFSRLKRHSSAVPCEHQCRAVAALTCFQKFFIRNALRLPCCGMTLPVAIVTWDLDLAATSCNVPSEAFAVGCGETLNTTPAWLTSKGNCSGTECQQQLYSNALVSVNV